MIESELMQHSPNTIRSNRRISFFGTPSGFTLIELLVTMVVSSLVILGTSSLYFESIKSSHDRRIKTEADTIAQSILSTMAFDIRNAGTGVTDLQGFQMGTAGIGQNAYPIGSSSDSNTVILQMSETGKYTTNTEEATPSAGTWSMNVIDSSLFTAGDFVHVSSLSVGDEYGLRGPLSAVSEGKLFFGTNSKYSTSAVFRNGSMVFKLVNYIYDSPVSWAGITLSQGSFTTTLAPNTTFLAEYYDATDTPVAVNTTTIESSLAYIDLTVYARGSAALTNGTTYTAWAKQKVAIPFLLLSRKQPWS